MLLKRYGLPERNYPVQANSAAPSRAGSNLEATSEVLDHLGEQDFNPKFGARPLKRVLQRVILNELSKDILSGRVSKDAVVEDGVVKFENMKMPAV